MKRYAVISMSIITLILFSVLGCNRVKSDVELFRDSIKQVKNYFMQMYCFGKTDAMVDILQNESFNSKFNINLTNIQYKGNSLFQNTAPNIYGQIRRNGKDKNLLADINFYAYEENVAFKLLSAENRPYFYFSDLSTKHMQLSDILIEEASTLEKALFDLFFYSQNKDELFDKFFRDAYISSVGNSTDENGQKTNASTVTMKLNAEDIEYIYNGMVESVYYNKQIPRILKDCDIKEIFNAIEIKFSLTDQKVSSLTINFSSEKEYRINAEILFDTDIVKSVFQLKLESVEIKLDGSWSKKENKNGFSSDFSLNTEKIFNENKSKKTNINIAVISEIEDDEIKQNADLSLRFEDEEESIDIRIPLKINTNIYNNIITNNISSISNDDMLKYEAFGSVTTEYLGKNQINIPDLNMSLPISGENEEWRDLLKDNAANKYPEIMKILLPGYFDELFYYKFSGGNTLFLENKSRAEEITMYGKDDFRYV